MTWLKCHRNRNICSLCHVVHESNSNCNGNNNEKIIDLKTALKEIYR